MRQMLSAKKTKKLRKKTGLPVIVAVTRGGTDHRIDLCLADGSVVEMAKDGTLTSSPVKWRTHLVCG